MQDVGSARIPRAGEPPPGVRGGGTLTFAAWPGPRLVQRARCGALSQCRCEYREQRRRSDSARARWWARVRGRVYPGTGRANEPRAASRRSIPDRWAWEAHGIDSNERWETSGERTRWRRRDARPSRWLRPHARRRRWPGGQARRHRVTLPQELAIAPDRFSTSAPSSEGHLTSGVQGLPGPQARSTASCR